METAITILASLGLLSWVYLLFGRSGFWRADQRLGPVLSLESWPTVVAIIPARNEEATIGHTIKSLLAQDYAGRLDIILVDDSSTDRTQAVALAAARERNGEGRVRILSAPALQSGWTGKLWALHHGVDAAGVEARFLWLTDADIIHDRDVLARLVSKADGPARCDLVSLMVRLRVKSFWERWLVPAFIFFFQMLYPFRAVNDPQSKVAGAAGGCILVDRAMLEKAGGIMAMKDALIDDCTLASQVQKAGGRLWLGLADSSHSARGADSLWPLWRMVKRTAFTQLHYSAVLLVGTILGLALVFLVPPVFLVVGLVIGLEIGVWWVFILSLVALAAMCVAYAPTLRHYGRPILDCLALPIIATLYMAMTVHSAVDYWRGHGSQWKGRSYGAGQ